MSELSNNPFFKSFTQVGVVVKDVDHSVKILEEVFGIGPFRVTDWPPANRTDMKKFYHGEPGNFTARMAFANLGNLELELIQPKEGESIWADFLKTHGEGIHHIRFNVEDVNPVVEYLSEKGITSIQHGSGLRPGTQWVNFDTENQVGFVIEIMNAISGTDGKTPQFINGKVVTD
jgi:methylmalonyl-CoA/ethylmalonyl-CoA epimerase